MVPNLKKNDKSHHTHGKARGTSSGSSSQEEVTLVQRTTALARGMILVMKHHDAPKHIVDALDLQVHSYLDSSFSEEVWLKRCKFLLTYPLAKYLRNELPPSPDMSFRPSGKLRQWMKSRLNGFNPENTHLWYSWFQSKRCTLPVSDVMVKDAYKKHFETLTKPDPGCSETIDQIFNDPTFQRVLEEVSAGVFRRLEYELQDYLDYCPKTSATFQYTRGSGGQSNDLRSYCGLDSAKTGPSALYTPKDMKTSEDDDMGIWNDNFKKYRALCLANDLEMCEMVYRPVVFAMNGPIYNFIGVRYCSYGSSEWKVLGDLQQFWTFPNGLRCTIQAVLEPNKIRIISKGEALPYYTVRPLQKAMRETLSDTSWAALTGRPISYEDIQRLTWCRKEGMEWFSVDYSAATDGLSWKYSGRIFNKIIERLSPRLRDIANLVLGPHNLYYPKGKNDREFWGMQTNGQLMGSVLSFPILCLANLGVYLLVTQEEQKGWTYQERLGHVLVNGDDMVYASAPSNWKKHVDVGKKVGLEMSPGKAYVHREYLNINSTSFHCPLYKKTANPSVREIGYLNAGLYFGQHKVQGRRDNGMASSHHTEGDGIVANIDCILNGALPKKKVEVLKELLVHHKDKITEECKALDSEGNTFHRNLFIPKNLGGMGVARPEGWKFRLSKQEVYVAHGYLKQYPDLGITSQHPLPGYEYNKFEELKNVPWTPQVDDDLEQAVARVPIFKVQHKSIRHLCRVGMVRFSHRPNCIIINSRSSENEPMRLLRAETPNVRQHDVRSYIGDKAGPGKSLNCAIGSECVDNPKRWPQEGLNSSVLSANDRFSAEEAHKEYLEYLLEQDVIYDAMTRDDRY